MEERVIPFEALRMSDVGRVGGKSASLGELISQLQGAGVRVPGGFSTTAAAFREFLVQGDLADYIADTLADLDADDVRALARTGADIRARVMATALPAPLCEAIRSQYRQLAGDADGSFAVRSSATAEDLPDASFAGQQESYLNIRGEDAVLDAVRAVFASLYNDRAIAYRVHQGFVHADVAICACVQRMVRSDLGAAGVMFTLDTESGFRDTVFITAAWGLGETVVQGTVNPDEFHVHKPMLAAGKQALISRRLGSKAQRMVFAAGHGVGDSTRLEDVDAPLRAQFSLSDADVLALARDACAIERHYGRPMDIEWGKDGLDGQLYILQARPETVQAQRAENTVHDEYHFEPPGAALFDGRAIGQKVASGPVRLVADASEMARVQPGDILVTDMTDPNWEPVMKRAAAIVTNRGGRTCHAAIIARELGIPALVGCGDATHRVREGEAVTVSCAQGDTGHVYAGLHPWELRRVSATALPELPVKIMLNVGNPERAFAFAQIPNAGVGLARIEFVINNMIGIHPKAVLKLASLPAPLQAQIHQRAAGYASPEAFFTSRLAEGVATIAAAFWPKPVIVRLSDFKSNEYRKLLGGELFEPEEENPMLGFRGAARYIAPDFQDCFALECAALKQVREAMGLKNVELMLPFVRSLHEAREVVTLLAAHGLKRGEDGLRLIMMCEIPSNALLAEDFLALFDGFSIGSNDLTQLTLGVDRDSGLVASAFDERNPAVKMLISRAIQTCNRLGKYVGICGQGPSDHPDFAQWLMAEGIQTLSLNPDSVLATWQRLAELDATRR